jgi:hypothetical protein
MYHNRRWFFTALSITTAGMLIAAPAVWADDDKKSDDHGGRTTTTQVRSEDRDDHAEHAAPPAVKVEHENEAVEHQNEEAVEHANEAAEEAAERAAEAAREAAEEAGEEAAEPAAEVPTFAGASLLAHLQNETAELTALAALTRAEDVDDEDEDVGEVEDGEVENEAVENVQVVTLSALTNALPDQATAITNAVTLDQPLVATFLAGTSPAAMFLKTELMNRSVSLNSVLAIVRGREHSLTIVTTG